MLSESLWKWNRRSDKCLTTNEGLRNGDLCELSPDPGKSPGLWKRSKEDACPFVMFSCGHRGSCYLEISEPESELFFHRLANVKKMSSKSITRALRIVPLWSTLMGKLKGEQPWKKSLIVKVLAKKVGYIFDKIWKMWRPNRELTSLTWATTILKLTDGESYIRARGQTNPIHPGQIRTDLVEWVDPLLYALLLSSFFPTRTRLFDYSWDRVETKWLWWRVESEKPMQQRTTAWIGIHLLYIKTDDRERTTFSKWLILAC